MVMSIDQPGKHNLVGAADNDAARILRCELTKRADSNDGARLHDDGTITVYGHVNEIIAPTGTRVTAGQEIATIGNRGQSTGPHLHFEVWANGKDKIDPLPWLAQRGIDLGPMMG